VLSFNVFAFVKMCGAFGRGTCLDTNPGWNSYPLSWCQGLDMPDSEQGLAVKTDMRVLSEGSVN